MKKAVISVVYEGGEGHAGEIAAILAENMHSPHTDTHLVPVEKGEDYFELLHRSDAIIFGCPTSFGNVSSPFKRFMESTESFWYRQLWKDKLAAAFTISPTMGGDKLNTLNSLFLFAAQHGMIWISQGILPRFINNEQTEGQNRLASYAGLMIQCNNCTEFSLPHSGDLLTTELFAKRIMHLAIKYKTIINNHVTTRN